MNDSEELVALTSAFQNASGIPPRIQSSLDDHHNTTALLFEALLLVISSAQLVPLMRLLRRSFHPNLVAILSNTAWQYVLFHSVPRLIEIALLLYYVAARRGGSQHP